MTKMFWEAWMVGHFEINTQGCWGSNMHSNTPTNQSSQGGSQTVFLGLLSPSPAWHHALTRTFSAPATSTRRPGLARRMGPVTPATSNSCYRRTLSTPAIETTNAWNSDSVRLSLGGNNILPAWGCKGWCVFILQAALLRVAMMRVTKHAPLVLLFIHCRGADSMHVKKKERVHFECIYSMKKINSNWVKT